MEWRIATAFVILLAGGGRGLACSITGLQMVEEVNAKLPKEERFEELGWYYPKTVRLYKTYRSLYPDGPLIRRLNILSAVSLISFVSAIALFGFPFAMVAWVGCGGGLLLWLQIRLSA